VDPKTRGDIWYVREPGKSDSKPVKFLGTSAIESQGQLSPDGRWLAYVSNETGRTEVYIREFPSGKGFAKVSVNGGIDPRWSKSGSELFYIYMGGADKELFSADVQPDGRGGIKVATPVVLFDFRAINIVSEQNSWLYSAHPDGQRFLVAVRAETTTPAIHLITNWRRLLKTGVPTDR
jgi:Tol biopolymer transport system component